MLTGQLVARAVKLQTSYFAVLFFMLEILRKFVNTKMVMTKSLQKSNHQLVDKV